MMRRSGGAKLRSRLSVSKKTTRFKSKTHFLSFRLRTRVFARAAHSAPTLARSDFSGTRPRKSHIKIRGEFPSDNSPSLLCIILFYSLKRGRKTALPLQKFVFYIFIVNEMRFFSLSTSRTFTLTISPTLRTSVGCLINLSEI